MTQAVYEELLPCMDVGSMLREVTQVLPVNANASLQKAAVGENIIHRRFNGDMYYTECDGM